jgi:predicted alpha/beta hydrolase family esterase
MNKRTIFLTVGLAMAMLAGWLLVTDNSAVWPIRNTLQYHLLVWLTGPITEPAPGPTGTLTGRVTDTAGAPLAGAWVLVAHRSGVTYHQRTDAAGQYRIEDIPPGSYRPVAGAPGFESARWQQVDITANQTTEAEAVLSPLKPAQYSPGANLRLSEPAAIECGQPLQSKAVRREVFFDSGGQPNQPTFYYTPIKTAAASDLPLLLAIYPGPADSWECASLPLAQAGFAVIAVGPAYTFELEADLDEQSRLLDMARAGQFPATTGRAIVLLGGSYSSLHVQRLLQRGQENLVAALLLGPPTDMFEMRRIQENGTHTPPFGLDKAFIAVGLPDQESLRYWDYSGAYHVRPDFPPLAILHSRDDQVVPYQQSELLAHNLDVVGAPHEDFYFAGASHYLMAPGEDETTQKIYAFALDFLARQIAPK